MHVNINLSGWNFDYISAFRLRVGHNAGLAGLAVRSRRRNFSRTVRINSDSNHHRWILQRSRAGFGKHADVRAELTTVLHRQRDCAAD